jgi:hypothetical protein
VPPLPRCLDDADHPQAVDGPLGEGDIAAEQGCHFPRAERTRWKRRQHSHNILRSSELDPIKYIHETPLAWISCPATRASSSDSTDVVLAQQQHLDGEMRMSEKGRERNEPVEHVHDAGPSRRATNRSDLAILVDADNSPFGRHGVHDPKTVLVEQRIELRRQRCETTRLHLDQLAVRTNQIDDETIDRHLQPVTWARQHLLDRSVQRTLAQHPDVRHPHSLGVGPAAHVPQALRPSEQPGMSGRRVRLITRLIQNLVLERLQLRRASAAAWWVLRRGRALCAGIGFSPRPGARLPTARCRVGEDRVEELCGPLNCGVQVRLDPDL